MTWGGCWDVFFFWARVCLDSAVKMETCSLIRGCLSRTTDTWALAHELAPCWKAWLVSEGQPAWNRHDEHRGSMGLCHEMKWCPFFSPLNPVSACHYSGRYRHVCAISVCMCVRGCVQEISSKWKDAKLFGCLAMMQNVFLLHHSQNNKFYAFAMR